MLSLTDLPNKHKHGVCLYHPWVTEKALWETHTLRAGCSKAEPNFFAPPTDPLPGGRDGRNLSSWRWSLPSPTNPVWWGL